MPRANHQAPLSQTNLLQLLTNTGNDVIPSSSSDVISSSNSAQSASPHRTDNQLQDCPVSPIFPPSPPSLSPDTQQNHEKSTHSPPLSPSFLSATFQADHSVHQLTQVEHKLTQEDHTDHKPAQRHNNSLPSEQPAPNALVYEQEAPVFDHSATENHNEGSCVLGKRKSSERDPHSSDDGYCTCGSSCDSTPSGSTATMAAATNCIYHNKVKRVEYQSTEPCLSSEGSHSATNVTNDRQKEESSSVNTEKCKQTADSSNANVNKILDEFGQIFGSPEAIAALQQDEAPHTPTAIPTCTDFSSNYQAEQLRASTTPQLPKLVEVELVADSRVSSSTGEVKMPDIELEVGLEEIAKREDEELKKAMEESLKQQVIMLNVHVLHDLRYLYNSV